MSEAADDGDSILICSSNSSSDTGKGFGWMKTGVDGLAGMV